MPEAKKTTTKAAPKKKAPAKKAEATAEKPKKASKYWEAVGRRKTSVARARIMEGTKQDFTVNSKPMADYFQEPEYQAVVKEALQRGAPDQKFDVSIIVKGGGMHSQAEAVRHALARALVKWDEGMRGTMKTLKFLTRDPRMRERKKFGLRRARRATQWRKR